MLCKHSEFLFLEFTQKWNRYLPEDVWIISFWSLCKPSFYIFQKEWYSMNQLLNGLILFCVSTYSEFQTTMPLLSKQLEYRRLKTGWKAWMIFMQTQLLKKSRPLSNSRIQRSFDVIKCPHFSYEFKNDIESAARWISRVFVTRPLHSMQVYSILYTVFYTTPILMRFPPHKFAFNFTAIWKTLKTK